MRKVAVLGIALLVLAVAASALAGGPSALKDTTWVGPLTFVHTADVSTATDNATATSYTTTSGRYPRRITKSQEQVIDAHRAVRRRADTRSTLHANVSGSVMS